MAVKMAPRSGSATTPTRPATAAASCSTNNQPRPEAVVLGRPPEGADYVRLPPLGAWSWSGPSFLPGTGRGFSVDDDFQAYPLSCESLPKPSREWDKHAGSLEALRVTRPEAVVLAG